MRALALVPLILLPLAACTPPAGAAVVKCSSAGLTITNPEKHCTVTVEQLKGSSGTSFDAKKFRHNATIVGDFTVKQGTVKISVAGSGAASEFTVTPEAPLHFELDQRLHRSKRAFTMRFESEAATGLAGTVNYRAQ